MIPGCTLAATPTGWAQAARCLKGSPALQGPAAALLTLDCSAALGDAGGRARLSTLGAAMLSTVLRFDKVTVFSTALLHPSGHSCLGQA